MNDCMEHQRNIMNNHHIFTILYLYTFISYTNVKQLGGGCRQERRIHKAGEPCLVMDGLKTSDTCHATSISHPDILGGSGPMTDGYVVNNHGDGKSARPGVVKHPFQIR